MTIEQRQLTESAIIMRVDALFCLLFDQMATLQSFNNAEAILLLPNVNSNFYFTELRRLQDKFKQDAFAGKGLEIIG